MWKNVNELQYGNICSPSWHRRLELAQIFSDWLFWTGLISSLCCFQTCWHTDHVTWCGMLIGCCKTLVAKCHKLIYLTKHFRACHLAETAPFTIISVFCHVSNVVNWWSATFYICDITQRLLDSDLIIQPWLHKSLMFYISFTEDTIKSVLAHFCFIQVVCESHLWPQQFSWLHFITDVHFTRLTAKRWLPTNAKLWKS